MKDGYVKLYRKIIDSAIFTDPELLKLWLYCLLKASHKEIYESVDGIKEPVHLMPGQFVTGRYSLHREYYQRKKKKQKSPLTVWNWMQILKNLGNIDIKSNNKFSIVTIVNRDSYQGTFTKNEHQNEQQTNNRLTTDYQQTITNKNVKNNKEYIYDHFFVLFWKNYPKKVGKQAAYRVWKRIKGKQEVLEKIKKVLPKQIASIQWTKDDGQYIPNPTTYLNQGRWEDEV
jgi:hypothetical protein